MDMLIEFLRWLPQYFFPKICYGCKKEGWTVCPSCRPTVSCILNHPICPTCHNPSPGGFVHPSCQKPDMLDGLISFYRYQGWAKEIIKQAKFGEHHYFRGLKELSSEFGDALLQTPLSKLITNNLIPSACILVPIPLHWWRERKRGFNQATMITKELSKKLSLALDEKLLKRTRYTDPQTIVTSSVHLSQEELKKLERKYPSSLNRARAIEQITHNIAAKKRLENIQGAFALKRTQDIPSFVVLVDDVWTTGATMRECCRVLKKAGVKKVWGVTLLRA